MNIVEQVARVIDHEGAYTEWFDGTGFDAKPHSPTTRQKYHRARAESDAVTILKLALAAGPEALREQLIEFEMQGWRERGIPVDQPELAKVVTEKYATPKASQEEE